MKTKFTKKQQLWAEILWWQNRKHNLFSQEVNNIDIEINKAVEKHTPVLKRYWTIQELQDCLNREKEEYNDTKKRLEGKFIFQIKVRDNRKIRIIKMVAADEFSAVNDLGWDEILEVKNIGPVSFNF